MHKQQLRVEPTKSPADLAALLDVLKAADINILAAGGSDVERGGEFAFAVDHEMEETALRVLEKAGYRPRIVEIDYCAIANRPGALHECILEVARKNQESRKVIRDISVGVADGDGNVQVQVYSEYIRSETGA
ncbi:MAG TPA: hypothetical protein VFY23_07215 [Candidatus Limnocylindrales bacterium]|nr:hypothetical protein [Candidatus Limnocylindrales bacterium]